MSFHAATLESNRVQKLLSLLRAVKGKGATTLEINEACGSTRASSDVSELRANGVEVVCKHERTTEAGRRIHRFWLAEFAPQRAAAPSPAADAAETALNPEPRTLNTQPQPELFTISREGIL